MKRINVSPRFDKDKKLEEQGLSFHSWDSYWKEDATYQFTLAQIEEIESATEEVHQMCLHAVKHVIDNNLFHKLQIPQQFWEPIRKSFYQADFTMYGRFDFAYDGINPPKMLEYNADTPTSILESAVCQWFWMKDVYPMYDQFNSLHERLIDQWKKFEQGKTIYVACIRDNEEDWVATHYLMDVIAQAGHNVKHIYIEDIGWNPKENKFIDLDDHEIEVIFKLYPWEWMMREDFSECVLKSSTQFVEPLWKSILSNKGILAVLWELYPNHKNLLPAYFESDKLTSYAKKPLFSREGANVELWNNGEKIASDEGSYGSEGYVYQALIEMKAFDGKYPVIGSWVVGSEAAGMCIREDSVKITTNLSNFVPHYFI